MLAVFVRLDAAARQERPGPSDDDVVAVLPTDLEACIATDNALVSRTKDGPFLPIQEALHRDAGLLDDLTWALELVAVVRYARWRRWLSLGLLPILVLVELERELYSAHVEGVGPRLLADVFAFSVLGVDLFRRVPRHARVSAIVLLGMAVRYGYMIARSCGAHPGMIPMMLLAAGGCAATLLLAPSRAALRRAVLDRLGASINLRGHHGAFVSPRQVGGAVAIATGLPLALVAARAAGIGIMMQGAILVAWAIVGPALLERGLGALPPVRAIGSRAATTGQAVLVGLAATLGLTHIAHYGLGAVAYASQCVEAGAEHGLARRLLDAESVEVTRSLEGAHAKWAYLAMTVLVVPVAEERVFRDVLQRALTLRFGKLRGLVGASTLFGLAHLGVYRAAMAQAALLGVGFGMAYEEGGLLAATLTHALWNLYLLG